MKNILLILFALLSCCTSFDRSLEDNLIKDDLSTRRVNSVLSLTGDNQRLAFGLLDKTDQARLWKISVSNKLDKRNFNEAQKSKIVELIDFIELGIPNDVSQTNLFRDKWLAEASLVLSAQEIYSIAYSVGGGGGGGTPSTDCNCNRGSIFACNSIDINSYCPDQQSTCRNPTSTGCGFLWQYPCNQVCKFDPA